MKYQNSLLEYKKSLLENVSRYPTISRLFNKKNRKKIDGINDMRGLLANDLFIFLAVDNPRIEIFEEMLNDQVAVENFDSVVKKLKENLFCNTFWHTISEIEGARYLRKNVFKDTTKHELSFSKSNQKYYDIVVKNCTDNKNYYVSVKSTEELIPLFQIVRSEILLRSLQDNKYRYRRWHIGVDYDFDPDAFFKSRRFYKRVLAATGELLNDFERDPGVERLEKKIDRFFFNVRIKKIKQEFPSLSYGPCSAMLINDETLFYFFGAVYARFLSNCHKTYVEFKSFVESDRLKDSRLIFIPKLSLYGSLYIEEIKKRFEQLVKIFKINELIKVDII
jgi:hypothetical protein